MRSPLGALIVLAGLALPAACAAQTPSVKDDCPVSEVRKNALPEGLGGGFSDPSRPPLWMGDDDFVAVLFYAQSDDPTISPGGTTPSGANTKILWIVRDSTGPLTINGSAPGGAGFTQQVEGGGSYPSIVDVPRGGCWTLDASVSGERVGSIVLPAK
ncbi:hypothetical protein J5X84_25040 [Streptosporangiaceae bacterium NEAU-GS5]|nr:hypothetical protein [Streptosporangiaceae bacterium NEAU-GS5]